MSDQNPVMPSLPIEIPPPAEAKRVSRRGFLGAGGLAAAVMAAGGLGLEPLARAGAAAEGGTEVGAASGGSPALLRRDAAWKYRTAMADTNRGLALSPHADNGDEARYASRIGSSSKWPAPSRIGCSSKSVPHNRFGEVGPGAYASYRAAVDSGLAADFENIVMGGP